MFGFFMGSCYHHCEEKVQSNLMIGTRIKQITSAKKPRNCAKTKSYKVIIGSKITQTLFASILCPSIVGCIPSA
jgi:hypothetical protein